MTMMIRKTLLIALLALCGAANAVKISELSTGQKVGNILDETLLVGGGATTAATPTLTIPRTDAGTNVVAYLLNLNRQSSGTPANGIGTGISFSAETAAANTEIGATIEAVTTDVTSTSEDFALVAKTMVAGSTTLVEGGRWVGAQYLAPDGTVGAPFLAPASDPDTGLYSAGANQFGITAGGAVKVNVQTTGVDFWTNIRAGTSGSYDIGSSSSTFLSLYATTSIQGVRSKALTESAATSFVQIAVTSGGYTSGYADYSIYANDSTDYQIREGQMHFSIVNKAGTETCVLGTPTETIAETAGASTLTNAFTCSTSPTNGVLLQANAVSSLTQTTLSIGSRIVITSGTATVTPQ